MFGIMLDLRIAFLSLIEHRRRSLLLAVALAIVSAALVLLNALSTGITRSVVATATTVSMGHLNISGYFKVSEGQVAPLVTEYPALIALVQRSLPELAFVIERGRGMGKIASDQDSLESAVYGVDLAHEPKLKLAVASGELAGLAEPNTIVIFESHARKLKLRVGDALTITTQTLQGVANTADCRVVAIARDMGLLSRWSVLVPSDLVRSLYQVNSDTTTVVQLHLKPAYLDELPRVASRLREVLQAAGHRLMEPDTRPSWSKFQAVARQGWTGQKLDVTSWQEELRPLMWTLKALEGLSGLMIVVLGAIVLIGIMNTLWIAIRERTREIGALRAMGMQRGSVVRMFMIEATLLGALSSSVGVGFGALLAGVINLAQIQLPLSVQLLVMRGTLVLDLEPRALAAVVLAIAAIAALAALLPALRAARLRPIDAMAHFD